MDKIKGTFARFWFLALAGVLFSAIGIAAALWRGAGASAEVSSSAIKQGDAFPVSAGSATAVDARGAPREEEDPLNLDEINAEFARMERETQYGEFFEGE